MLLRDISTHIRPPPSTEGPLKSGGRRKTRTQSVRVIFILTDILSGRDTENVVDEVGVYGEPAADVAHPLDKPWKL